VVCDGVAAGLGFVCGVGGVSFPGFFFCGESVVKKVSGTGGVVFFFLGWVRWGLGEDGPTGKRKGVGDIKLMVCTPLRGCARGDPLFCGGGHLIWLCGTHPPILRVEGFLAHQKTHPNKGEWTPHRGVHFTADRVIVGMPPVEFCGRLFFSRFDRILRHSGYVIS